MKFKKNPILSALILVVIGSFSISLIYSYNLNANTNSNSNIILNKENEGLKLISAIGEKNTEGYVYADDLYDIANLPNNPDDALSKQIKESIAKWNPFYKKTIPLYSEDGETVIGKYKLN